MEERFSIREYTSKIRSVDVLKCWPFGQTKIEYIEAFLPPITVKKFKWWTDELENEVTEDQETVTGFTCPVCLVFKADSANGLNGHVDKCIVQSSKRGHIKMKTKSRVPKKRSIVELFAVAPQVERVYEDDDDEDEDDVLSNQDDQVHDVKLSALIAGLPDKRKRKMKLRDGELAAVDMNFMKKKKKKKRKNGMKKAREADTTDNSINHKDKLQALRQKNTFNSSRNIRTSSHTLGYAKDFPDAISDQKKNQSLECFRVGKKTKAFGSSKLSLGKQKSVFSSRGILKKHSKVVSGKKSTRGTFLDSSSEANWCAVNQLNRHVRFSGKDDIIGRRIKSVPHDAASSETNHSAEERDKFIAPKVNRSDSSCSINRETENEALPITEKQTSDTCLCVGKLIFARPHVTQEHLFNRPVSSNQVANCSENMYWLDHGYKVASPDPSSACPRGLLSMGKMTYKPSITTRGGEKMSMPSASKVHVISHYGDGPRLDATCSKDYVTPFPQAFSSTHVTKENWNGYGGLQFPPESTSEYTSQNLQYRPIPHLSPKELMRSICSPPDMEQRGLMHLGRSRNEDYIGLPLNSHGEFIQLHSSGQGGYNPLMRSAVFTDSSRTLASCTEPPSNQEDHLSFSNYNERTSSEKQFHLLSAQGQGRETPNFMMSSRLGATSRADVSLDFMSGSCHSVYPNKSGIDLMSIPNQSNRNDQIWNHSNDRNMYRERHSDLILGNGTQPTMRLMGQEFSVGKNYRNLHEEKVWMDNQIMVHHDGDTATNESSRRHFQPDLMMRPGTAKNKETAFSSEVHRNMLSQSVFQIIPPDSRFTSLAVGCQTNAVYENACRVFGRAPVPQPYPYFPPDISPAILNKESSSQEPFVCEYEHLPVNHQLAGVSSSYSTYQNLSSNYSESTRKLSQPYSTSSAFRFPFLYNDLGERVQPYNCQSSLNSITPSSLNATQVNETMISSFQPYSNAVDTHHPCMSNNIFEKTRPICCPPDIFHRYSPLTSQSCLQKGPDLPSIARPPPPPICPRFLSTSTMNNKREYRLKFKERMKARLCVKDSHKKRTKKRPGTKPIYSLKPTKLATRENLSGGATTLKAIGDTEIDAIDRKDTLGLDKSGDVAIDAIRGQNATQIGAGKAISGTALAGPVKLTAGAKHILNPSECMYGSNSKLTHSKVPFTALSSSGMASESPIKPSKIFQF